MNLYVKCSTKCSELATFALLTDFPVTLADQFANNIQKW